MYKLGEFVLKEVKSHSYLGITISHDLKWGEHVNTMVNKANRVLGVIPGVSSAGISLQAHFKHGKIAG